MQQKNGSGFTLIEIMVVMAIMVVIFSLIGPLAQTQLHKVKASEELYKFTQLTKNLAADAFFRSKKIRLDLNQNTAKVYVLEEISSTVQFEHLQFGKQQVHFNAHGYPDKSNITFFVRKKQTTVSLIESQEKILGLN